MSEWMRIESAPKDGTYMLGIDAEGDFEVIRWEERFAGPDGQWVHADGEYTLQATHWMPLPAPPAERNVNQLEQS